LQENVMNFGTHQNLIGTALLSLSSLLLTAILVLQFIAPSVFAATQSSQPAHQEMGDHSTYSMLQHSAAGEKDDDMLKSDCHHESAVRCMPTLCCFHETSALVSLAAVGMLLPSTKLVEQTTLLPSHSRATKDRPPKYI